MNCDNCGNPIRFPLKDARVSRTNSSYQVVMKYYCEVCYSKFKAAYDPYNRATRKNVH